MRRFSFAFALLFVASLVLAAYGHCWPMLAVQMQQHVASDQAHHHDGHQPQHHHPTEGFGQELSEPGVPAGAAVVVQGHVASSFPAPLLAVAIVELESSAPAIGSHHRARAGPSTFEQFHARTGRLLI